MPKNDTSEASAPIYKYDGEPDHAFRKRLLVEASNEPHHILDAIRESTGAALDFLGDKFNIKRNPPQ